MARALPHLVGSFVVVACLSSGCAGGQKTGGGTVNTVLRRIDVAEASFDRMKLNVVVAVENGTEKDVLASADVEIAIAGEAKGEDAEAEAPAAVAVDEGHHKGHGSGQAAAFNTSELLIPVELPLPKDPKVLEGVLQWQKMRISVDGKVTAGSATTSLNGEREVAPPHLPEVRLKEAQVASVDEGVAGTGFFTVVFDNKNPFAITLDHASWTIAIKGKTLKASTGNTDVDNDSIPGTAVGEYQAEVLLNEAAFGKDLKALLKSPTVPYVLEGTYEVRGIKKTFRFAGEMKFAR